MNPTIDEILMEALVLPIGKYTHELVNKLNLARMPEKPSVLRGLDF